MHFYKVIVHTHTGGNIFICGRRYYKYINYVLKRKITYFEWNKKAQKFSSPKIIVPLSELFQDKPQTHTTFYKFLIWIKRTHSLHSRTSTEENGLICGACSGLWVIGTRKRSAERKAAERCMMCVGVKSQQRNVSSHGRISNSMAASLIQLQLIAWGHLWQQNLHWNPHWNPFCFGELLVSFTSGNFPALWYKLSPIHFNHIFRRS